MTVLITKSVCVDCIWRDSCQSFKKIDDMSDRRNNPGHSNDIFQVIVAQCSMKNVDRSYKGDNNGGMYYCTGCRAMHHEWSRIGKLHKKQIS